jgi:hypothetical protein
MSSQICLQILFIDAFEQERIEWQQDAEQMRLQIERSHTFEHEILDKKREISEIQKALSDSRLSIYDERQQFMKLKREFDLLLSKLGYTTALIFFWLKFGKIYKLCLEVPFLNSLLYRLGPRRLEKNQRAHVTERRYREH